MLVYNIYEAKAKLSRLINEALSGEEVVIAKRNKQLVKIIPFREHPATRKLGTAKGKIIKSSDFDTIPGGFDYSEVHILTLRLDDDTEREIEAAVKTLGVTKSELIRRSIKEYLTKIHKPSFGEAASPVELEDVDESEDLSEKVEARLREKFSP